MTLARALSKLGILSRTQARAAILAGRVSVDRVTERDPDRWVDPDRGSIELDGRRAGKQATVYFALHKPAGVITTRADERGRRTVYDLLPADLPWMFPVGRLDLDSSGLLLLTNDTQLADAVASSESVAKVYDVTFDAPLTAADRQQFAAGMTLADGTALLPVGVELLATDGTRALLTLREGRNRQIRRMAKDRGREVVRLHRLALGPLQLGELPAGALRPLTPAEVAALQRLRAAHRRQPGPRQN